MEYIGIEISVVKPVHLVDRFGITEDGQIFRYRTKYCQGTIIQPIRVRLVFGALKYVRLHIIADDIDDNGSNRHSLATIDV